MSQRKLFCNLPCTLINKRVNTIFEQHNVRERVSLPKTAILSQLNNMKASQWQRVATINSSASCKVAITESGKPSFKPPLSKSQAQDLVLRLTEEERQALFAALQEYQSEELRQQYQGNVFIFYYFLNEVCPYWFMHLFSLH